MFYQLVYHNNLRPSRQSWKSLGLIPTHPFTLFGKETSVSGINLRCSLNNLVPRLLSTLPVPSRCERTLVLSGHVVRARLPYEVGVG